jgi:hypothetical protein
MKYSKLKDELKKIAENDIWHTSIPKIGDHIRTREGFFYHHAIFISENEVFHMTYGNNGYFGNEGFFEICSLDEFSSKRGIEVRIYSEEEKALLRSEEEIVKQADALLGAVNYDLIFSNCEHYINEITLGKFESNQVKNLVKKPIIRSNDNSINNMLSSIFETLNEE